MLHGLKILIPIYLHIRWRVRQLSIVTDLFHSAIPHILQKSRTHSKCVSNTVKMCAQERRFRVTRKECNFLGCDAEIRVHGCSQGTEQGQASTAMQGKPGQVRTLPDGCVCSPDPCACVPGLDCSVLPQELDQVKSKCRGFLLLTCGWGRTSCGTQQQQGAPEVNRHLGK